MEYELANDLQEQTLEIIKKLEMDYIDPKRIVCMRGTGSKAKGVIARLHGMDKPMQLAMNCTAFYIIEFLELFEKCSDRDKTETIIHELLHIPKNFGGGFRHHDYVKNRRVKELYKKYTKICEEEEKATNENQLSFGFQS